MNSNFRDIAAKHLGPPVNIEAIIRSMGIALNKKADLDDQISGQLKRLPANKFEISANKSDHYFRQRFTMAHELGHYLLHAHLIGEGVDDSVAYRSEPFGEFYNEMISATEETEANQFAARLLMPKSKIIECVGVGDSISELAKKFQVSKQAMNIRLQALGYIIDADKVGVIP
ncbi:ImmA/IrrE family metallo-endopeptidase [Celeribacter sp. PS-C1]|uniref:ImmA/IrrE family metallo-endopeptidase n=1 Tax=Celeribacter sp. PS-C1 TaxID=2820813 RepID=UPI001CA50240|nr:ImmA/IrrE family metallo-endopeptidase [Celeribacter sp. PS-C1]MBW6416439.1 ImmA/IrrE family metallo-endopeptidase [Celeribacter sp. PS-C1]